jgi:predicted RNA-binding Zn-ribbon protein involved in translation (DUF1610 family)
MNDSNQAFEAIFLVVYFVVYFVVASKVGIGAWRRGHSGWWIFIAYASVFLNVFGYLVLFLIWITHRKYIKTDHQQRQCPNCGGYKVNPGASRRSHANSPLIFSYMCNLCGFAWAWQEGTPWPVSQVRPDLIQKGAKKLEEDAAAAAAAFYWQQQQNNKKRR